MTNLDKCAAISWAAREHGRSYGNFAASLTTGETEEIYRQFREFSTEESKRLAQEAKERRKARMAS